MKLSKQQVEAIAFKIKENIVDPINKHNSEIRNSVEYIDFENSNEDCLKLKALLANYDVNHYMNQIIIKIKNDYFKHKFLSVPNFGRNDCNITNDIILEAIEYDNLDELINNISKKYTNA